MKGRPWRSCLYFGRVMHKRLRPFRRRFEYRIYTFLFDLDELPDLDRELPLFSHNRSGVFSFWNRDHGPRDGSPLKPWAEVTCAKAGVDIEGGRVELVCLPRLFGYAFNPLSLWFCYDREMALAAIIYEVRNTFGQHHSYVIPVAAPATDDAVLQQSCDKHFYVSPFLPMEANYRFRLRRPGKRLSFLIRQSVRDAETLLASWTGRRARLGGATIAQALLLYPLLTFRVMLAIHWQALWLWIRGAVFHHRPLPPEEPVTLQVRSGPQAVE